MAGRAFKVHPADNVATLLDDTAPGPVECIGGGPEAEGLRANQSIPRGHKIALADIGLNLPLIKFGIRIGHATGAIKRGNWVHLHNVASDFDEGPGERDALSGDRLDTAKAYV